MYLYTDLALINLHLEPLGNTVNDADLQQPTLNCVCFLTKLDIRYDHNSLKK